MSLRKLFLATALVVSSIGFAMEKPGGFNQIAVNSTAGTYEVLLSPSVTLNPDGAYLSSELRYQASEDIGVGFGFGAGEVGYNFGGHGIWYVLPDTGDQPAFAVLGGLYINSVRRNGDSRSYVLLKFAPTVSKSFASNWGKVTPYGAFHFTPSFGLNSVPSEVSLKATAGTQFLINSLGGVKLWGEFGLGIARSAHEVALGISYPFVALGG